MKFLHPSKSAVSVTHDGHTYPVVDGIIDCPPEMGGVFMWKHGPALVEDPEPVTEPERKKSKRDDR